MPRDFFSATAEQVVAVVDAASVFGEADPAFAAEFTDLSKDQAEAALQLAADLGLLQEKKGKYSPASPLCRPLLSPREGARAVAMRVVLESYEPFRLFRERLLLTPVAATAAQQTKAALQLQADRERVKDTLISLGTYSQALVSEGAGRYRPAEGAQDNALDALARACGDLVPAEVRVREQLGPPACAQVSHDEVVRPLTEALLQAAAGDARGAVVRAGNAVESYLTQVGAETVTSFAGATGVNAKLDRLEQARHLPKKLGYAGRYLGHIRNAADHGIDPEINAAWSIRRGTGLEYVFVACSFISALVARRRGEPPEI